MSIQKHKEMVAEAAIEQVLALPSDSLRIGIGTGSTSECFIKLLPIVRDKIDVLVSSSERSSELLREVGFTVCDLNETGPLDLYVDGADEINEDLELIKGGGAALTREKVLAYAAEVFICIADQTKLVDRLGTFPVPIEVLPMARNVVARELVNIGAQPIWREGVVTDNGNWIIDAHGLDIDSPKELESQLELTAGVVCSGVFAHRAADIALVWAHNGLRTFRSKQGS